MNKTLAILTDGKHIIGYTETDAPGGATVSYGPDKLPGGGIVQIGRAKISRSKKNFADAAKMPDLPTYHSNQANR